MVANNNKPKPNHLGKYFTFGEHTFGTPPRSGFKEALRNKLHTTYIDKSVTRQRRRSFYRFAFFVSIPFMLLLGIFLGLLLFPINSSKVESSNTSYSVGAVVSYVDGDVQILKPDGTRTIVSSGVSIHNLDTIKTTEDGRVVITFFDGSSVRIASDSEVRLLSISGGEVGLESLSGELYARISDNGNRFKVFANGIIYSSLGTAYRVINTADRKGVEVYHNKIFVNGRGIENEIVVSEGNRLYTVDKTNPDFEMRVVAVSNESLQDNSFVQWNKQQDINVNQSNNLGVLADTTKLSYTKAQSQDGQSISISWGINGLTTSLIRSTLFVTKVSPGSETRTFNISKVSNENAFTVPIEDFGVYTVKICVNDSTNSCVLASDLLVVDVQSVDTNPTDTQDKLIKLASDNGVDSIILNWTVDDSLLITDGFRIVMSATNIEPIHGIDPGKFITNSSERRTAITIKDNKPYYVRICRYISSSDSCDSYSNVIVVAPTSIPKLEEEVDDLISNQ